MMPDKYRQRLRELFEPVILLPREACLPQAVSSHPDMLMCALHGSFFLSSSYYSENKALIDQISALSGLAVTPTDDIRSDTYPLDTAYNVGVGSGYIICRCESASRSIIEHSETFMDNIISVRQGYSACSCLITDTAVITSDSGIAKALGRSGIPCVLLDDSDISLPGYSKGFIGGASGYYDGKILIFGNAEGLSCFTELSAFAVNSGCTIISLSDDPNDTVTDYGGIKIFEKII